MADTDTIRCTIFKGKREPELYVYVPWQAGKANIPSDLQKHMGELREVMTIMIGPDKKLARARVENVLKDINEKGYYLQLPPEIGGQVLFDGD
jgi:uncharacterized protein YcgL (UPF0745 family)